MVDVRITFVIAIGILLFTIYYLEREMKRDDIYWLFAGLSVITALATTYLVAKKSDLYQAFITFTVVFILIAILYHDSGEGEAMAEAGAGKEKKAEKRKK